MLSPSLKADHRKVEDLFEEFEAARATAEEDAGRADLHGADAPYQIEEDIFYPACEGKVEEDLLKEAYVEHDGAKVLIAEIEAGGPDDEFYDAKVKVLSEMIKHHVEEEEKRVEGMFSQARHAGLDMDSLAEQMAAEKQQLMAAYEQGGLPRPRHPPFRRRRCAKATARRRSEPSAAAIPSEGSRRARHTAEGGLRFDEAERRHRFTKNRGTQCCTSNSSRSCLSRRR